MKNLPKVPIESKRFAEGDYNVTGFISVDKPFAVQIALFI